MKIKLYVIPPITRPKFVNADAAYDTNAIRRYNKNRGIKTNIPVNIRNRKEKKVGRPKKLDKIIYKGRSAIERF